MSNEMTRKRFHNTRKFLCLLWDPYTCMTQIYGLIRKTASHKRRSRQLLVPAFFLNGMLGFHCSLGLRKRKKRLSLLRVSKRSYEIRLWINTIDPFCQLSLSVEALCHAFLSICSSGHFWPFTPLVKSWLQCFFFLFTNRTNRGDFHNRFVNILRLTLN